ncbi:segregation/condensation protein A [Candidatus Woesearchaeota archaeon]|nr:segregation/condensation protein A [Candidatus Woesearchaeota archaeon]
MDSNEKVQDIIFNKDEITWQSILYELISSEQMNPWDIDVSAIVNKYIKMIRSLQEHDFRLSGKVILAAAILLKIKSKKWIEEDIANLDNLFASQEDDVDALLEDVEDDYRPREIVEANLIPRTPQPRKRKVSIYDLVSALEKALEVKHRRILRDLPILGIEAPKKKIDITEMIKEVFKKIHSLYGNKSPLTFSSIVKSSSKEDKILAFVPLLHLVNMRKIDINQYEHFGEIEISVRQS